MIVQNAKLLQQLSDLRQRYNHAKQTMKSAQEKLDRASRRKEELLHRQTKINNEAIIAQSKYLPQCYTQHLQLAVILAVPVSEKLLSIF